MIVVSNQNVFIPPSEIRVFPNPASEIIYVEFDNTFTGPFTLKLKNALGATVKEKSVDVNSGAEQLLVDGISSGIYFLEIVMGNQRRHVEKVVIVD